MSSVKAIDLLINVLCSRRVLPYTWRYSKRLHRWLIKRQQRTVTSWIESLRRAQTSYDELVTRKERKERKVYFGRGVRRQYDLTDLLAVKYRRMIVSSANELMKAKQRLTELETLYVQTFIAPGFKDRSRRS